MTPEYYSFLRAQVDRLSAAGASKEELESVTMSYLAQERTLKFSNVRRLDSSGAIRLRLVESGR